jgi:NitT/TauT family transport system ATP-binding protein/nitrate/nitrite transport system substrate-binding protein
LVVAKEKGLFRARGLTVELRREASWATVREKLEVGALDGAHLLAPIALAAALAAGMEPPPILATMALNLDGPAITLARRFEGSRLAAAARHRALTFAVVYPFSSHNYLLRDWLVAAGLDPERDTRILVAPPQRMPAMLADGAIDGFCAGEPWNTLAASEGLGRIAIRASEHWGRTPDKILGVGAKWAEVNEVRLIPVISALVEAAAWCDDPQNHRELAELLARTTYIGQAPEQIAVGLGDIVFHRDAANAPKPAHGAWLLGQMARWGQAPADLEDGPLAGEVYRPDLYRAALGLNPQTGR